MMQNRHCPKYIRCHVTGCTASSSAVVVYSVKRDKDGDVYKHWLKALGLSNSLAIINACQRHFPAGAPTRNHPNPNPKLFNPIPKDVMKCRALSPEVGDVPLFNHSADGVPLGPNNEPLPPAVEPPPGSIIRLAPNATLIDLKKIKEEQDLKKPFQIEEVTVLIDEKDTVKVVDYDAKLNRLKLEKQKKSAFFSLWEDNDGMDYPPPTDVFFSSLFSSLSLGSVLEEMRQHRIDCNIALTNEEKSNTIFAHSIVLVARSPYFYRHIYLKHNRQKYHRHFRRIIIPIENFDVVEAVISFMYTGCLDVLMNKRKSFVQEVLALFEMKEVLETYEEEYAKLEQMGKIDQGIDKENPKEEIICEENIDDDEEEDLLIFPLDYKFDVVKDADVENTQHSKKRERKRKRKNRNLDFGERGFREENFGKMKVSVQKIVNSLNLFFGKIEEILHPSSSLHNPKTKQFITIWPANNILLTKLFDQNDLTNFFSETVSKVLEDSVISIPPSDFDNDVNACNIESLFTCNSPNIEDVYTKPSIEAVPDQPLETLHVGNVPIISYQPMDITHIPKYVHLIAMYRFNICMKNNRTSVIEGNKNSFLPHLLEADVLQEDSNSAVLEDLVHRITPDDELMTASSASFQQVSMELKRRVVSDLELFVNPSFHEELIMQIVAGQVEKNLLPLTLALFLAKGCNFCRKKECKTEDLLLPISPDNPVCPDRQCINRNLQCNICHKQMATSKSLARHKYSIHDIQIGDTSGLFICSHCGETFSKKWKLNLHERQHEDRKMEVSCSVCKKVMHGTMALKKHINMVHETKPRFSCKDCQKAFKRKETLRVHRRIHTGEKPFRCQDCDYASETKGNLKAHILRKHKVHIMPLAAQDGQPLHESESQAHSTDDQVMAATIVAHNLSDVSFILSPPNPGSALVP